MKWTSESSNKAAVHCVIVGFAWRNREEKCKAIIQFYKLINAINHEVIFDWMNVRRLNRIGRNLLISFILTQAYMITNYWEATRLFELEGYEHNFWCDFQPMTLIMGLIALLVGRIFAIGLQMKEEQELTI